jgi:hypothetical protein
MLQFETGKIYYCRSACNYDCVWNYIVERRTDTSIWIRDVDSNKPAVRRNIKRWSNVETVLPLGSYSMAPCLSADRIREVVEA